MYIVRLILPFKYTSFYKQHRVFTFENLCLPTKKPTQPVRNNASYIGDPDRRKATFHQQEPTMAEPTSMDLNTSSTTAKPTEVAGIALSMRVPAFWRDRPRLWFITFEAATHDLKKGQTQLAQLVIAQLEKQDIEQISDLLYNPPADNYYDALKKRLTSVYEESEGRQFQKLLSEMELGEQKPSQLLRRMRDLAREKVPESTLRLMWMNHLPVHVRSVLVVSDTISKTAALDELALLADKMLEQTQEISAISPQVHHQQHRAPTSSAPLPHEDAKYLIEEIRKLSLEVAALRSRPPYQRISYDRHAQRSRSNARSPSRSRGYQRADQTPRSYCYYHQRFGRNARKCQSPCTFVDPQNKKNEDSSVNYTER